MHSRSPLEILAVLIVIVGTSSGASMASGQSSCVTSDEVKTKVSEITSGQSRPFVKKLEIQLLKLEAEYWQGLR
jgi:hypothetical protein